MKSRKLVAAFGLVVVSMTAVLGLAVVSLPNESEGLATAVHSKLDQSGVKNPVTAVLLNFRGYDTLLELTVLLLALLGARALSNNVSGDTTRHEVPISPVLLSFIRIVAPLMVLVAGYMLWVGGHAPGGAFQAGAVLAALGVILKLGGVTWAQGITPFGERWLLAIGIAVFLAIGVGSFLVGRNLFEFSPSSAKWLILTIEAAATVSIAVVLLALFSGGTILEVRELRSATSDADSDAQ